MYFWEDWGLTILMGVVTALFVGLLIWATATYDPQKDPCIMAGGHWLRKDTGGVGITSGGNVAFVPSSVRFCISEDGRIIE